MVMAAASSGGEVEVVAALVVTALVLGMEEVMGAAVVESNVVNGDEVQ